MWGFFASGNFSLRSVSFLGSFGGFLFGRLYSWALTAGFFQRAGLDSRSSGGLAQGIAHGRFFLVGPFRRVGFFRAFLEADVDINNRNQREKWSAEGHALCLFSLLPGAFS